MTLYSFSHRRCGDSHDMRMASLKSHRHIKQRGSVLIMALISLLILMLASVALISSTDTSLLTAGNLAFKRDLANQAERAVAQVRSQFVSGALVSETVLYNDQAAQNYWAHVLPSTKLPGIPDVLTASAKKDDITDTATGIRLRYVIDRMCISGTVPDKATCTMGSFVDDKGGTGGSTKVSAGLGPVYRLTIMALGPRNTQTFTQITFTH
ncbi:hypothetical protein BCF11_2437 [Collimonas sp. PA-H2]|uniref:pilus assembly PilX family protein n=1 Tax=Collimonas sp. PA-H2 TaxID=1881062 RepID=UPI000BF9D368|nr:hypothetical protein [Collimonas sp. PA-H2]PFH10032.1 hypothetical protein BCF11_2437 [Collimonas sp. PA-H2]